MTRLDLERVRELADLPALLEEDGVELVGDRARCPFHEEQTPSFRIRLAGHVWRWHCFGACARGGDAIDYVMATRGCSLPEAARMLGAGSLPAGAAPRPRAPRPARTFPPAEEVAALWESGLEVEGDHEVAGFLRRRGVDPGLVTAAEARALPPGAEVPAWAAGWRRSHRLLLPLFDATGALVSVKARDVSGEARAKELCAKGYTTAGTLYANQSGVLLLRRPEVFVIASTELLVVEGGVDFLAACLSSPWRPVWSVPGGGHWTSALAARVRLGVRVLVATDPDEAGDAYADAIAEDLGERCALRRVREVTA